VCDSPDFLALKPKLFTAARATARAPPRAHNALRGGPQHAGLRMLASHITRQPTFATKQHELSAKGGARGGK
jgi:hypothetical protein